MKTSGTCAACQGKLSLWAGLTALTPFYIRCPHCRTKLRVRMRGLWLFFLFIVLLFVGGGVGWFAAWRKFGWAGLSIGFACCAVVWLLVEAAAAVTLYTHAEFTFKESDRSSRQEASKAKD
jgi:DNA-directed RNA polymerase subunit RPC12/RpoP